MAVHVFTTMGTAVSLRFAGPLPRADTLSEVERTFDSFDRRFSLYRSDSELSRVARGELRLPHTSPELRGSYAEALEWGRRTSGAFTPHRPDGVIDLSGIVKAQAIEAAGTVLTGAGERDWLLNAGGDILGCGAVGTEHWRVGIVDPDAHDSLLVAMELRDPRRALATSGTAERGQHIWLRPASPGAISYRQVSVLADDILTADALATAIFAGGPEICDEILDRFDVDALTVDASGVVAASPGFS